MLLETASQIFVIDVEMLKWRLQIGVRLNDPDDKSCLLMESALRKVLNWDELKANFDTVDDLHSGNIFNILIG